MKNIIAAVAIVGLIIAGSYAASRNSDNDDSNSSSEPELVVSDETTVGEAEANVRKLVELDGQELRNTILTNSEDALVSLKEITPSFVGDEAAVGDFYFVFETKQVLYRPSINKIVQMVAVTRPDDSDELENPSDTALEGADAITEDLPELVEETAE